MSRFGVLFDATDPVKIVLAADPAVVETNTDLKRGLYLLDGDTSHLEIPQDAARVIIRAATPEDDDAARRAAGRFPHRGRRVAERMTEHKPLKDVDKRNGLASAELAQIAAQLAEHEAGTKKIPKKKREELIKKRGELRDRGLELVTERADIVAEYLEELSDKDEEAYQAWRRWTSARLDAMVYRCLVGWEDAEGIPNPTFEEHGAEFFINNAINPPHLRAEVLAEIDSHITRLSRLGEEGKALYARGFGSAPPRASTPPITGSVPCADTPTEPMNPEEPVEAPLDQGSPAEG